MTSVSPPDGGDEQQWAACLVAKTGSTFFRRNSPEPDQARESFLLKNDIALFSRPAGLQPPTSPHSRWLAMPPHPPASPPAGPFDSRPLPRLPAAPRAWQPCRSPVELLTCPAALPPTSTARARERTRMHARTHAFTHARMRAECPRDAPTVPPQCPPSAPHNAPHSAPHSAPLFFHSKIENSRFKTRNYSLRCVISF